MKQQHAFRSGPGQVGLCAYIKAFGNVPWQQLSYSFNLYGDGPYILQDSVRLKVSNLYIFLAFINYCYI